MTPMKKPRLIGLTGTNGAGKGEAAAYFQSKGLAYHSLSDIIREELRARGLEPSRDNLIRTGNELRAAGGPDVLARRTLEAVADGRAVIDSIRNTREVAYFRAQAKDDFVLLAIDAPVEIRFARSVTRGRDESAATLEEFKAKEDVERGGGDGAQQLEACMAMADALVTNDGTLEEFHAKLERWL
jgi:dephospho-CoA kinase